MLNIYETVVRFLVAIRDGFRIFIFKHGIISFIMAGVLRLILAFFTYTTVVDWLTIEEQTLKISITILAFNLPTFSILWVYGFMNRIVNYRKWSLFWAGVLGIGLAFAAYYIVTSHYDLDNDVLESSFTILALGLPTFFILWLFRTDDVQEQLKKTEENTNNSTLFECARLLTAEDPDEDKKANTEEDKRANRIKNSLPQKIALTQLAYLRRKTSFDKEKIDSLTKNLFLYKKEFSDAQFSGINLYHADLRETILRDADLSRADLIDADLSSADLRPADLIDADLRLARLINTKLRGADLSRADLRGADLSGAKLIDAKLINADLRPADSSNIDFQKPTNLSNTKLGPDYFRLDDLSNTDYSKPANLTNADLRDADLSGANLSGAICGDSRPVLEGAKYNSEPISTGTIYIRKTIFPDWLDSEEKREEAKMIDISAKQGRP